MFCDRPRLVPVSLRLSYSFFFAPPPFPIHPPPSPSSFLPPSSSLSPLLFPEWFILLPLGRYQWRVLFCIGMADFTDALETASLPLLFPVLKKEW